MFTTIIISFCAFIIGALCFALYLQNQGYRYEVTYRGMLQDIVQQVNFVHNYIYQFEQQQEQNIMNLDKNIKAVYAQQQRIMPNASQLCIGSTCITESDLIRMKNQLM